MSQLHDDIVLLIHVMNAEIEQNKEYDTNGTWHTDECWCEGCQALYKWKHETSFWRRLKAKLYF